MSKKSMTIEEFELCSKSYTLDQLEEVSCNSQRIIEYIDSTTDYNHSSHLDRLAIRERYKIYKHIADKEIVTRGAK